MSLAETRSDATVEECLDELNDFVTGLQRYSPTVIAVALRVHLGTLLQALLEGEMCTREEVRDFVKELERRVESASYGGVHSDAGSVVATELSTTCDEPTGRSGC